MWNIAFLIPKRYSTCILITTKYTFCGKERKTCINTYLWIITQYVWAVTTAEGCSRRNSRSLKLQKTSSFEWSTDRISWRGVGFYVITIQLVITLYFYFLPATHSIVCVLMFSVSGGKTETGWPQTVQNIIAPQWLLHQWPSCNNPQFLHYQFSQVTHSDNVPFSVSMWLLSKLEMPSTVKSSNAEYSYKLHLHNEQQVKEIRVRRRMKMNTK